MNLQEEYDKINARVSALNEKLKDIETKNTPTFSMKCDTANCKLSKWPEIINKFAVAREAMNNWDREKTYEGVELLRKKFHAQIESLEFLIDIRNALDEVEKDLELLINQHSVD